MGTNITGIGNANAIGFKSRVTGGMYFPPELKDALVGVWSAYGKSNDSTDRNVIKNKIKDRGGDFELLNFDYKEGSGYGKYNITLQDFPYRENVVSVSDNKAVFSAGGQLLLPYPSMNKDMPSFRIKVSGLSETYHFRYYYRSSNGVQDSINMAKDGYYDLPICYNVQSSSDGTNCGFANNGSDVVTIEQIPQFQGAVVTDGVDDLIVSQKSIKEMLEGSNEITVISMIHQISLNANYNVGLTNYIRSTTGTGSSFLRNDVKSAEKTGIYGYTASNLNSNTGKNASVINKILGDKNDYTSFTTDNYILDDSLFHVQNFTHLDGTMSNEGSQVAWYWTFIAKRVLTEDEINLVIEKYNLDRPGEIVKPDVYYDIKRQKITNENHSSFDDELTDFSGNGHNMKLYNFAWEKQSGIGNYPISFKDYTYVSSRATVQVNKDSFIITSNSNTGNFLEVNTKNKTLPIYKVKVEGTNTITNGALSYRFNNTEGVISRMSIPEDGEYEIPESPSTVNSVYSGWCINGGTNDGIRVKITIIPEHESALVLDGIDDYGKVTGLPILKDYTIAADYIRTFAKENAQDSPILSKSKVAGSGAFLFNYLNVDSVTSSYSFGTNNGLREINDSERRIYYLSKYVSDGYNINAGSAVDYDSMWLGTYRDNISNFFTGALHFAMLFPYSLSEFLIERQINKVKAGTLYPDMIEWRPVVTKDDNITNVKYYTVNDNVWTPLNPGDMVPVGQHVVITVDTILPYKVDTARSSDLIINRIVQSAGGYSGWDIHAYTKKNKTPQKIKITTAVNESIVQWKPTITSNLLDSFTASSWYLNGWDNTITVGTWIKKTDRVFFKATFKTGLYGLETATFGGAECTVSKADNWSDSTNIWDIRMLGTVGDLNQVFNLDVYELIRFEDIVQPYPVFVNFIDENDDIFTWGGKAKVGSQIRSNAYTIIFKELYDAGGVNLNGIEDHTGYYLVQKKMVFEPMYCYYKGNVQEPKCIFSPSRLKIPNSSYKILGYIPDVSGHGNHGKINNSAYVEGSGVNEDGSWQFDGVDDFVTIPTLSSGGKQVLMKVNWSKNTFNEILYDQRENLDIHTFAIYNHDSDTVTGESTVAYNSKNSGNTYIDGILNYNIKASELKDIKHNITITNESVNTNNSISPIIGTNKNKDAHYAQMSLYDFMLFNNISTDDEIKKLNEYVGIEKNVFAINPNISIDTPEAVKNIKIYQGGKEINSGYLYLNKDTEFEIYVSLNTGKYSLDTITVDGEEATKDRVVGEYNIFKFTFNGSSEQNITIHSYEYTMYEDIVQPFPTVFRLLDTTNNYEYTYGDKLKVGSKVKFASFSNLLPELYRPNGTGQYNGVTCVSGAVITVEKQMVFGWSAPFTYLKTNAPKCIFSPSKLRIPNESYRYLGYIPDISGNGNNGKLHNFAFSKMSGANGYVENFNDWRISKPPMTVETTDSQVHISYIGTSYKTLPMFEYTNPKVIYNYTLTVEISGIPDNCTGKFIHINTYTQIVTNGINTINFQNDAGWFGFTFYREDSSIIGDCDITIKQVGDREGSICFDGVDDYITIPTLNKGGKQVLMKVNWNAIDSIIYDQRGNGGFAIYCFDYDAMGDSTVPAYKGRNAAGITYIDGIKNEYIIASQLRNITHNIIEILDTSYAAGNINPIIGKSYLDANYGKMALYDFMLFDEISTDEEIKEFNNIVGIEGDYVQKPDYYWDAYGKTNLDEDRTTIQQRGVVKGYNFAPFDNELDWYLSSNTYIDVVSRNGYTITLKNLSTGIDGWRFQNTTTRGFLSKDIPFKLKANKRIRVYWDMHYNKVSEEGLFQEVISNPIINPNEDTLINLKHLTEEKLTELNANKSTMYYILWFDLSTLAVDEEVTIEMLPVEGGKSLALTNNNFAYDKMSGYEGYSFSSFNDISNWAVRAGGSGLEVISRDGYSITFKKLAQYLDWDISNNEYRYPTILNKELPFKCKSNKKVGLVWQLKYKTEGATSDTTVTLINQQLTPNVPLEISLPYKTQDELTELGAVSTSVYYLLYFSNTTLEIGEEYTVEMLPLYPNALLFDGVDDYSKALNIVAPTDYTYILSRELLGNTTGSASMYSGWFQANGGGAFIADYSINSGGATDGTYGFSFGRSAKVPSLATDKIIYGTTTSVNGADIIPGSNLATGNSITLGQWDVNYKKMVFYKLFLYPRTIDMLSINMVKNMMEEGGIIDITSKLFTDKYTGDYDFKDFNNDFFIGD